MILLADQSAERLADMRTRYPFVGGQLLTPLSRYRLAPDVPFAVDNGAFSGFDRDGFLRLLDRLEPHRSRCLWVAVPDVVGSGRRTLEVWDYWWPRLQRWPLAFVAQDGMESLPMPWDVMAAVFVGGSTEWKESRHAEAIIRAAQALGKRTHVGRVNTRQRWQRFAALGVESADGTGVSRYDWMLDEIAREHDTPLLDGGEAVA